MDLWTDVIFQEVLRALREYYNIMVHMVPGYRNRHVPASSQYPHDEYLFTFRTHRGEIKIAFTSDQLENIIQRAIQRDTGRKINPSIPSETNIVQWLADEYIHLYQEKKKNQRKSSFTDGYGHYNPNDGKGTGNKKSWKSAFSDFDFEGFANEEESAKFHEFKGGKWTGNAAWEEFFHSFREKAKQGGQQDNNRQQSQQKKTSSTSSDSPHAVLGLDPLKKPTEKELQQAYRKKCMEWHPDRNAHRIAEAEEMFKKVNNANQILKSAYGYK
jgi:hypothetical protein